MRIQVDVPNDCEQKVEWEWKGKEHGVDDPTEEDNPLPDVGPGEAPEVLVLLLYLINSRDLLFDVILELKPYLLGIVFNDLKLLLQSLKLALIFPLVG